MGQSNKVVLYTASVAGALTFSKVGLNREGRDGRAQQKGQESQKTHKKTKFLLRVGGSGKVKGHATTQTAASCSTLVMRMYARRSAKSCVQSTELYVNILKNNNYDVKMKN